MEKKEGENLNISGWMRNQPGSTKGLSSLECTRGDFFSGSSKVTPVAFFLADWFNFFPASSDRWLSRSKYDKFPYQEEEQSRANNEKNSESNRELAKPVALLGVFEDIFEISVRAMTADRRVTE